MSLDWYLIADPCPHCGHRPDLPDLNITHNLAPMAKEAGIYNVLWRPDEFDYVKAKDAIEALEGGLALLRSDPVRFSKFDAPNGWGTYRDFVPFVEQALKACRDHPDATIGVSR